MQKLKYKLIVSKDKQTKLSEIIGAGRQQPFTCKSSLRSTQDKFDFIQIPSQGNILEHNVNELISINNVHQANRIEKFNLQGIGSHV